MRVTQLERELEVAQEKHEKEIQTLLAYQGRTISGLAATLTHELNSPLAALMCSLQTMGGLPQKGKSLAPDRKERLKTIQATLSRNARLAADRIRQIVRRIERLSTSGEGELRPVDFNVLLQDVANIVSARVKDKISIEVVCEPLPQVSVRPQQVSRALLDVLQNTVDSVGQDGWVRVSTRQVNSHLEIVVEDNGRSLSAKELAGIFDPCFTVKNGQVVTGNWSLFGSRQVMVEHGGDIRVEGVPGRSTTVWLTIPCRQTPPRTECNLPLAQGAKA